MTRDLALLSATAGGIGLLHTLLGPDHYVPFIALARARRWPARKTLLVTALCGVGHVGSSALLGLVGVGLGLAASSLEAIESRRADLAAWALICLGLIYLAWGLHRAGRHGRHSHFLPKALHRLRHDAQGLAQPATSETPASVTPWALFVVLVLGPCEPLIPVLMVPAATNGVGGTILVAAVFALTTIATMLGAVFLGLRGLARLPFEGFERYSHALAGGAILLCGIGVRFLGL